MTLVISILTEDKFYMISDTMLSVEAKNANSNDDSSYPTKPDTTPIGPRVAAGLTQKVVTIRKDLFVGWSDDYATARKFIDFLRICFKNSNIDENSIKSAQADYFALHSGDLEKVSTLIVYEHSDGVTLFPQGNFRVASVASFGTLYVLGSGAEAFSEYFVKRAPQRFTASGSLPSDIDIIYFIMDYIVGTVRTQQLTGSGVGDGWGGWFEILLKKESDKLEKLDRIMYASMLWEERGGSIITFPIGRRYFQYYDKDNLLVFSQSRSDKPQLNLIPPPDHGLLPQRIALQQTQPQLLCLKLINSGTKDRRLVVAYNELGHNFCGFAKDVQNGDLLIEFNADKLTEIIRAYN